MLILSVAQLSFAPLSGSRPRPLALPSPRATTARPLAIFPSDLTPDDIVRARRKALQEERTAMPAAGETPAELRAAMGELAAQEKRFAAGESALLECCAGLLDEGVTAAEPQRAQAVLQAAISLELEAKREAGSLQPGAVRAGILGDWRLVFTDSPQTLGGGLSGLGGLPFCSCAAVLQRLSEGSEITISGMSSEIPTSEVVTAQCVEVVRLPLGVRSAV